MVTSTTCTVELLSDGARCLPELSLNLGDERGQTDQRTRSARLSRAHRHRTRRIRHSHHRHRCASRRRRHGRATLDVILWPIPFKCSGLFWRRDEVDWTPGRGTKGGFRLLGHRGVNKSVLRVTDFCDQLGIYILYGNTGAYYVGLARTGKLGGRLKNHTEDEHKDKWDRFSGILG
jgi:hypothetical protein